MNLEQALQEVRDWAAGTKCSSNAADKIVIDALFEKLAVGNGDLLLNGLEEAYHHKGLGIVSAEFVIKLWDLLHQNVPATQNTAQEEPKIIKTMQRILTKERQSLTEEDRDLVHYTLSNRKFFDYVCANGSLVEVMIRFFENSCEFNGMWDARQYLEEWFDCTGKTSKLAMLAELRKQIAELEAELEDEN